MERCHAQRSRFTPDSYLSECLRLSASSYRGTIFPESDPVLMDLDDRMVRIPKLYPAADGGYAVVSHSYVSGPSAAKSRGTDVVYYYDEAKPSTITAAIRFGLQAASIVLPAHGYAASEIDPPGRPRPIPQSRQLTPSFPLLFLLLPPRTPGGAGVHGGAVEAVLDDALGTVVRHCRSVWMATSDFKAKLRRPCPVGETLLLESRVEETHKGGLWAITKGEVKDRSGQVVATAAAKMVDTLALADLMRK